MKRILLSCVVFFSISTHGQDLIHSRTSGHFTFIYKITNEEAKTLYESEYQPLSNKFFHTLIDFYPTDSGYHKPLSTGHYLYVNAKGATLHGEIESVNNLEMTILNNHRDLLLLFHDRNGKEITTLKPGIGIRSIPFSKKLNAYRISTTNRRGWIDVTYEGHTSYFEITRQHNNTLAARTKRRVLGTFPINHILSPIFYLTRTVRSFFSYPHIDPPGIYYRIRRIGDPKNFEGYMVANKPKYKPGDTVRIKAFVVKGKNGKPVSKTVDVILDGYRGHYFEKKIGEINSYRSGAYVYEFTLNDSLKLTLDYNYSVSFRDKRGNKYPSTSFDFEQYELKQNFFSLRSDSGPEHKPATLFLKGTDANDLPLYDIQVEVIVKSKEVKGFESPTIFVKDTLWRHSLKLDPLGETKVVLPDSIFPKIAMDYEAAAIFTNTDNERQVKTLDLKYNFKPPHAEGEIRNDSVTFTSASSGDFELNVFHRDEIIRKTTIQLPYAEKLDPYVSQYQLVQDKKIVKSIKVDLEPDMLEVAALRTKDSLRIRIQNPRELLFRYQLFRNNKIIESGNSLEFKTKRKTNSMDRYYFAVQYVWAGEAKDQNYDLPFARKPLKIEIDHPSSVFPGQSVDVTVHVRDAFDQPVKDVDLTAYAITKKFRDTFTKSVPNFEHFKSRKIFNEFRSHEDAPSLSSLLDYTFWRKRLGLDSIAYYHFLYPEKGMYMNYSPAEDSITQLAPFVVRNGNVQPVYYLYIDNELKYYHDTESIEPYSFQTKPGKHSVTIRLWNRIIKMKDVSLKKGMKLILSIDLYNLPAEVENTEVKFKLSDQEINALWPHFLALNRDVSQSMAYFRQGDNFRVMPPIKWSGDWNKLVGPFSLGPVSYHSTFTSSFNFKPGKLYTFSPTIIERQDLSIRNRFKRLHYFSFSGSVKDQVQTEKRILEFQKSEEKQRVYRVRKYPDNHPVSKNVGALVIQENKYSNLYNRFATFIINLDAPDEYYIFPGNQLYYSPLLPGKYQVVVIYNDESYLKPKPVEVKSYGRTFYNLNNEGVFPPDTFSHEIITRIKKWSDESSYVDQSRQYEMQDIRELYYRQATYYGNFSNGRWVTGKITDSSGEPIPGVNVILKGTTNGTVTNANGEYRMFVPVNGVFVFSFIGYSTQEVDTRSHTEENVQLQEDATHLSEVVIIGYGARESRSLTGSVSSLQGRLAGVTYLEGSVPGAADSIRIKIRGVASLRSGNPPLIVIDGVLKSFEDIDESKVTSMEALDAAHAIALYGSRASNGVVLISTKPGMTRSQLMQTKLPEIPQLLSAGEAAPGTSLRKNFRDYAFWQPKLVTNGRGEATFRASFPDDITGWNINVLGMASRKRTGSATGKVQSFKPLAAQLALPNFLIEGDTAWAIGKITNYGADSLVVKRTIAVENEIQQASELGIKNSLIDSIKLIGAVDDTISVKYAIEYKKYEDGELRKIPMFPVGSNESVGFFAALPRDTTFSVKFDQSAAKIKIYAQADMLDVLADEIDVLRVYPYECNEQLASKLKALLAEKRIAEYRNEKFTKNNLVEKTISKLITNQHKDGSWSWWGMKGGSHWITIHVGEALLWASQEGFKVKFDQLGLKKYLSENTSTRDYVEKQLKSWIFLSEMGEPVAAKPIVDSLESKNKLLTIHDKLLAQRLLQLQNENVDWSWLEKQRQKTLKGNWYWGEPNTSLWNNDVSSTLLVYRLMEKRNPADPNLLIIRNYFFENRKRSWRNTYESSRIIETILPGLLKQQKKEIKPTLTLNGTEVITAFPYEKEIKNTDQLSFSKTGTDPVYVTAYREIWNSNPQKVEGDFSIKTLWQENIKKLKAGKPVKLQVTLEVKKSAEYVMINVPIPAGCTYNLKNQSWSNGEVHREYDLHETRIYCESLRAGTYHYTIELLPRYKGKYHLNPAKAEWMYFPVIYGREEMKKVSIN